MDQPRSGRQALRLRLLGVLGGAAVLAPAGAGVAQTGQGAGEIAAATTIATLHGPTEVRAWSGVQAWTDYSTVDKRWHVVVRSAGKISIPKAIPAGDERLEVDVGPGPDGEATLAFVSCARVCRMVVSGLDGGRARTVPGSAGASSPTIWGSRVAWVRGHKTVLARQDGGKVTRLAGVLRRKCYFSGRRRCERPLDASVKALELHGSRLALIDRFGLSHGGGNGHSEVRMESVRGGRARLVALVNIGEAGQAWIGPSWAKGDLFSYKSCPGGCAGGAYRYHPKSGAYAKAGQSTPLAGFAMEDDSRRAFQAVGDYSASCSGDGQNEPGALTCALRLTGPLSFRRTRSPLASLGA